VLQILLGLRSIKRYVTMLVFVVETDWKKALEFVCDKPYEKEFV